MEDAVVVTLFGALAFGMWAGSSALWRWMARRRWKPPLADEAVAVACGALAIKAPMVFWVRGEHYVDVWGRDVAGTWVPGRLTIAKGDDQPFSMTALAFELAREARMQREGVRDESEPPDESPDLLRMAAIARAALIKWEAKGHA